jgi:hypothetical protein
MEGFANNSLVALSNVEQTWALIKDYRRTVWVTRDLIESSRKAMSDADERMADVSVNAAQRSGLSLSISPPRFAG